MTLDEAMALLLFKSDMETVRLQAKAYGVTDDEWKKTLAAQYEELRAGRLELDTLPDRMRSFVSALRARSSAGSS